MYTIILKLTSVSMDFFRKYIKRLTNFRSETTLIKSTHKITVGRSGDMNDNDVKVRDRPQTTKFTHFRLKTHPV